MARTIETDDITITFDLVNNSFDHEFGHLNQTGFEIRTIKAYIPALNDWLDVTHMTEFYDLADKLIEKEMEKVA